MQNSENIYSIGKIKQLIDLNGDTVNFEIDFNVESESGESFDAVVVDQSTLDNNKIEYKKAENGKLSGTITNDKNVYQNYFLILKADKDINCKVSISKKELPRTVLKNFKNTQSNTQSNTQETKKTINWLKVFLVFVFISMFSYFLYNLLISKEEKRDDNLYVNNVPVKSVSSRSPSIMSDNGKIVQDMNNWKRSPSY
jgi:hypothetical protein